MEILKLITLFLYLIKMSSSQNKTYTFELKYDQPFLNLTIGEKNINAIYSGLRHNSPIHIAINNDTKIPEEKYTKKNSSIKIFGSETVNGKVYKDNFKINGQNLEMEFLSGPINYTGFINFGIPSLEMLKGNNTISKKILSYNTTSKDDKIYMTLGKEYNLSLFNYSHTCDIINKYSGCIIDKVVVANSTENFKKGNYSGSENIGIPAEFYDSSSVVYKTNFITGNSTNTEKIKKLLTEQGFNCSDICEAPPNKSAYFVFGKKGIRFTKIKIYPQKYDNILFGFKSIDDLDVIIDAETNHIVFHSEKEGIIVETKTTDPPSPSNKKWLWYVLIIVVVIVLVVGIFLFVRKQKNNTSDEDLLIQNYNET